MQRWAILPRVVLVRTSVIYMTTIIGYFSPFYKEYLPRIHDDIGIQKQGPGSSRSPPQRQAPRRLFVALLWDQRWEVIMQLGKTCRRFHSDGDAWCTESYPGCQA